MDHAFFHYVPVPRQYLLHNFLGVALREPFLLLDVFVQIAVGTVFKDEVVEVGSLDDLMQSKDVLVNKLSVDLYFCLEHFEIGPAELLEFYHFDGKAFVDFFYLYAFVDLAAIALPQHVLGGIFVDAYFHLRLFQSV